jgi:hypothetical protein
MKTMDSAPPEEMILLESKGSVLILQKTMVVVVLQAKVLY